MGSSLFMLPGLSDAIVVAIAIACGVLAIALLFHTLWTGRSRGRARCPRCWYDLSALNTETLPQPCSECGRTITHTRQLHRLRWRRWTLAPVALLVLAGAYLAVLPAARAGGWMSLAPSWALRAWLRAAPHNAGESATNELIDRLLGRAMTEDEARASIEIIVPRVVRFRPRWPKNHLVAFSCDRFTLRRSERDDNPPVVLSMVDVGQNQFNFSPQPMFASAERFWIESTVHLASPVRIGEKDCILIEVHYGRWPPHVFVRLPSPHTVYLPIQLVDSIDEVITPVQSPEIDALVRTHLAPRFFRSNHSERAGVQFRGWKRPDAIADLALGIRVELIHNGKVLATARGRDDENAANTLLPLPVEFITSDRTIRDLLAASESDAAWVVRVRADPEMALHDLKRAKYWAGSFDMTLAEFFSRRVSSP
jgi:hypothetical protein